MVYPIPIVIGQTLAENVEGLLPLDTMYAYNGAWASRPSAAAYPVGTKIRFTDQKGEWETNGTDWIPVNGSVMKAQMKLPLFIAPTFTGTTNGAVTLGTAMNIRTPKCFMYFAANSLVASHPAGFYYVEMSSTTAAVVYNNTYTPAAGVEPVEPSSKTIFSGAVPGGTGVTSEVTAYIVNVFGGEMGKWGVLDTFILPTWSSTAGAKTYKIKLGSTVFGGSVGTNSYGTKANNRIQNKGAEDVNIGENNLFVPSNFGTLGTVNTSVDTTLSVTMQLAVATDFCGIAQCSVRRRKL